MKAKQIRIVLDARIVTEKMHGIARYTLNLLHALLVLDKINKYIILHNHPSPEATFNAENRDNVLLVRCRLKPYSLSEQLFLPGFLKKYSPDIYHTPTFSAPIFQICPTLMTIHDMIHLTQTTSLSFVHKIYYLLIVKRAALKASKVITVSEHSKLEISKILKIPLKKINVTYNGIDHHTFKPLGQSSENENKETDNTGYLLFVGNTRPHKNLKGLIKAYNIAKQTLETLPPLVIVGVPRDFIDNTFETSQIQGIISVLPKTDCELATIYRNASLFIAPSYEEGFGLPVLEAMSCGIPIVASNIASIKEIAGLAAGYFNPADEREMAQTILTIAKDPNQKSRMIETGLKRAKQFSWAKTGSQTLELYKKSLNSHH